MDPRKIFSQLESTQIHTLRNFFSGINIQEASNFFATSFRLICSRCCSCSLSSFLLGSPINVAKGANKSIPLLLCLSSSSTWLSSLILKVFSLIGFGLLDSSLYIYIYTCSQRKPADESQHFVRVGPPECWTKHNKRKEQVRMER